jgi:hypothetical protein
MLALYADAQALPEEAAKSGAGGGKWTERLPVRFEWLAAA